MKYGGFRRRKLVRVRDFLNPPLASIVPGESRKQAIHPAHVDVSESRRFECRQLSPKIDPVRRHAHVSHAM